MNRKLINIYSDFLITSFGQTTATNLAQVLNNEISHDTITRFLADKELNSRDFWKIIKPEIRRIQKQNAMIAIDDFLIEKPYSNENGVIAFYFDHVTGKYVKAINVVDAVYLTDEAEIPLDLEVIKKLEYKIDIKTAKPFREQTRSKQEIYRSFLRNAINNGIPFAIVLNDIWYASIENMIYIKRELSKDFIMAIKSNRQMKLIGDPKYQAVSDLTLEEGQAVDARIECVPFIVRLVKAVFVNEDGSIGVLFLVSSLHDYAGQALIAAYHKRWRIEEATMPEAILPEATMPAGAFYGQEGASWNQEGAFYGQEQHKSAKQNASIGESPVQLVAGRVNHVFCSFVGVVKLELMQVQNGLNHFALRNKLYMQALKASREELIRIRGDKSTLVLKAAGSGSS